DYVSGAADAAYYVGECRSCRATIANVVATLSAVGYSGTNATGVVIRDSVWDRNGAGIVPNTYANEGLPPQGRTEIVGNTITGSGNCLTANTAGTALPRRLQSTICTGASAEGDRSVASVVMARVRRMFYETLRRRSPPPYTSMPAPPPQPGIPAAG